MPDFWSHRYAADQALIKSGLTIDQAHYSFYQLGAQGPDLFYYLNRTRPYLKTNYRHIGNHLHHKDMFLIFSAMIDYVVKKPSKACEAYLYGYYSHYVMDVFGHPFICEWGPDSHTHKVVEMQLDAFTIQALTGKSIYQSPLSDLHPKPKALRTYLAPMWDHIIHSNTPFAFDSRIISRSGIEFKRIQWLLIKDIVSRLPLKNKLSKCIGYDLELLIYPKHKACPWDLETYLNAFKKGMDACGSGLSQLYEVLNGKASKTLWLESHIQKDYLGK